MDCRDPVATIRPVEQPRPAGAWQTLKDAIRGTHHTDYTQGSLRRAIFLLAVPMVLEMIMESVFAVVDIFFVASIGADAVAAVGLTESLLTVLYAVAIGLSIGATALVARRIGEKDPEQAARTGVQAILLALLVALPIAGASVFLARPLLEAMGASPWVLEHGVRYTQIMLMSTPSIMLLFLINAIFRGAGDAVVAMRTLWLANGINIVLAPCLIKGYGPFPEMGVVGAAVATTIGRSTGVLFQLACLFGGRGRIAVGLRHLRLQGSTILSMVRISGTGMFQVMVGMTSWVVLMRIVSTFGSVALAGYTIAIRIVLFALLPSWGLANAAATLVGQNLGARQPDRAEASVWTAAYVNMVFLGSLGLLFVVLADPIAGFFTSEAEVAAYASRCLRIVSAGFVFYAFGMVVGQALNGAGDTFTPTLLNILCFWLCELPLAWALSGPMGLGPDGAFWSIATAFSLNAALVVLVFRRGRWKQKHV